jgi:hypothetical protein
MPTAPAIRQGCCCANNAKGTKIKYTITGNFFNFIISISFHLSAGRDSEKRAKIKKMIN